MQLCFVCKYTLPTCRHFPIQLKKPCKQCCTVATIIAICFMLPMTYYGVPSLHAMLWCIIIIFPRIRKWTRSEWREGSLPCASRRRRSACGRSAARPSSPPRSPPAWPSRQGHSPAPSRQTDIYRYIYNNIFVNEGR